MTEVLDRPAAAPPRTLSQRMDALQRANEIRSRRAQLKRDLKAGRANVRDIIGSPPDWVETMKLFDLLLALPKFGRVKTSKELTRCVISPSKTVGGLSDRQRGELLAELNGGGRARQVGWR